jgi:hypothetical protein
MPSGSDTGCQLIVNGVVTDAPSAGLVRVGAGGGVSGGGGSDTVML